MTLRKLILLSLLIALTGCSVPNKIVKVYFYDKNNELVSVDRELPTIVSPVLIAMDQLFKGPNEQEAANGLTTTIPAGTRSRKVEVEDDLAIVDLNSAFAQVEGGTAEAKAAIAQIVYTATSVKGINKVLIKAVGDDQFTLGSQGYTVDHPLERRDVKD